MEKRMLNDKAFEKLFREYFRPLTVYAIQYLKHQEIAEDVVQGLFLELYEKRKLLKNRSFTGNYLYKSVHNRCLNSLHYQKIRNKKKSEIQNSLKSNTPDPFQLMSGIEFEHRFLQVIEILSPQCRKIFEMSRLEHKKNQEIADELKLSKRTVEAHITQALKIMRKKLNKYLPVFLLFLCFIVFFSTCDYIFKCYY
jgi:RNA polymerase sigma-70 factor (family 1)